MNSLSRAAAAGAALARKHKDRRLASRTVRYTSGASNVTYTKAKEELVRKAKLNHSRHSPSIGHGHAHAHTLLHSGKTQSCIAKTRKQVLLLHQLTSAVAGERFNGRINGSHEGEVTENQQGRLGLRNSKRRAEAGVGTEMGTGVSESKPKPSLPEAKKAKLATAPVETRSKKILNQDKALSALTTGHSITETAASPTQKPVPAITPAPASPAAPGSAHQSPANPEPARQRPKRATAGRLMFIRREQQRARNWHLANYHIHTTSISRTPKALGTRATPPTPQRVEKERERDRERSRAGLASLPDVPVLRPSAREFQDPLVYLDTVRDLGEAGGLCRVVPPPDWRPECKLNEEMRFVTQVQHVHKLGRRWGHNVQKLACIRKHLKSQGISMDEPPLIGE